MARRILIVLASLAALVVLAVAGVFIWAKWFLDPGAWRGEIAAVAERYTGRELVLEGELSLELFPRIGIATGPLRLAPREGFGEAPMIEAESLTAVVAIRPLISGEVEVDMIRVVAPTLRLGIGADGATAWGDIVEHLQAVTGRGSGASDTEALGAGAAALAVNGLEIENGSLYWSDAASGQDYEATGIEVAVDRLRHLEFGDFDLAARVAGDGLPEPVDVSVSGRVRADFNTFDTTIEEFVAKVEGEDVEVSAQWDALSVDIAGGGLLVAAPRLAAALGEASFELSAPELRRAAGEDAVVFDALSLSGPGLAASGELVVRDLSGEPGVEGRVETGRLEPGTLLAAFGVDTSMFAEGAFADASLTAEFSADADRIRLSSAQARFGGNDVALSGDLVAGDPVRLDAVVESERFDVDGLLAAGADSETAAAPAAVPLVLMQSVEGVIEGRFGSLQSGNITYSDLELLVRSDAEALVLERLEGGIAEGSMSASARIAKSVPSPVAATLALVDVDAGSLLQGAGLTERVTGTGSLRADLAAADVEAEALLASLGGTASLSLADGELRGIDIAAILRAARAGSSEQALAEAQQAQPVTAFERLDALIRFDRGVGTNDDLELVAQEFTVRGGGTVDLVGSEVDYRLEVWLVEDGTSGGERTFEPVPIPLRIRGALDSPRVSVDTDALMKAEARRQIQREAEERGIEARDARGALEGLLRRRLERALE